MTYAYVPAVTDSAGTVHMSRRPIALPYAHGTRHSVGILTECGTVIYRGNRSDRSPIALTCARCARSIP